MNYTQRELLNNFHRLIYEKQERYTPDRIPFRTERAYAGRGGKKLKVATAVAYRSHGAIRDDSIPEFTSEKLYSKRVAGRNIMSKKIRPIEQKYLRHWANQVGLMMDNDEFDRKWNEQGKRGEAENNVYYDEEQSRWFKRNNLGYHSTYLEFFYRLALQNELFPEAPYSLEGFVENEGQLEPIISQPHVRASRGASPVDVEKLMKSMGYQKVEGKEHDFYNPEKGIKVEDMHDENVLMDDDGNLYVVDPVIYLDDDGKRGRITSNEPLQHEL